MSDSNNEPVVEEGAPSEKTRVDYVGSKIPLALLFVWVAFFAWMIAYVAMYMVPAFPN